MNFSTPHCRLFHETESAAKVFPPETFGHRLIGRLQIFHQTAICNYGSFPNHANCKLGDDNNHRGYASRPLALLMRRTEVMMALLSCKTCGLIQETAPVPPGHRVECARCGEVVLRNHHLGRARTMAFSMAALFLYVPANIYPVLTMHYLGRETENTVWGGVRALWQDGMWGVAVIVLSASMVVPLLKLLGLFFLVSVRDARWQRLRTQVHKYIEKLGPWAMLDVFLLAIMVAVIRFGKFATVIPGPGIVAFTSVVVLTLLASASYEPQQIWNRGHFENKPEISA
jgi:paraquat-inducible protein A